MNKQIGIISNKVAKIIKRNVVEGTPIYIGVSNIQHIKSKHFDEYNLYLDNLSDIIENPDYVGYSQKNNSIEYIKTIEPDNVLVAVRVSNNRKAFVKTMYAISSNKVDLRLYKGYITRLTDL